MATPLQPNNVPVPISFMGYISGTTLTVTSGAITIPSSGAMLTTNASGFISGTAIPAGYGTTFTVTNQTAGSIATPVSFTAYPYVSYNTFVYDTQDSQNAANMVYISKKGELASSISGTLPAGVQYNTKLVFKTDRERMQYLLGLFGRSSLGLR